jgi:septal ring factor EnvC (AmiA/AmiB activator)
MFSLVTKTYFALCISLFISGTCYAEKKVDSAKENLEDVHQKIESLKKELDASQGAHKDAADALKASETAISLAKKKLHQINIKQQAQDAELKKIKNQSLALNDQLAEQQKQLSQQLYQQYLHNNQSYTQLILENKDPNIITRDMKYYSYIAKARSEVITEMQANLNKIQTLNEQTAATLKQIAELKTKQESEKQTLEQQKIEKAKVVQSLSKKIAEQSKEIQKLKRDEKDLSNLVKKLTQLAAQAKRNKEKKSKQKNSVDTKTNNNQSSNNQKTVIAKNEQLPDSNLSGINFSRLKGKLRLPVKGDLINRFGSQRADTGVDWKGLFIKANEGSEVRSIASGSVVFADWMRGFGNLIIIDHGNGYMSLYGNNQALLKEVGDEIKGGDAIASVGNSGGNDTNGLYYELRKNSVPFDPLSWSSLR